MTIDNIETTIYEFIKRLQLPESEYSFGVNCNNDVIEFMIFNNTKLAFSASISNGSIRVIYDNNYGSIDYLSLKFLTPITLLYYLCIFFFSAVHESFDLNFNDVLSIILLNEIYDWKSLIQGLSDNLGLSFKRIDNYVCVNDIPIRYNNFTNTIKINDTEIKIKKSDYCSIVEDMFKCVEYIANLMDSADNLFLVEEEINNLLEEDENDDVEDNSDFDFDVDVDMTETAESENAPEPVKPVENETFEEPQEAVITPEDVI
jgi:hypothetical protein